jgi:NAD-dependent deacetylase
MRKLVVLTGAGISAESGIKTFRDSGGLWENHRIEDVATPEAWRRNPKLVLDFYNERRKQAINCKPNHAHKVLVDLEEYFDVTVITQNVDHLHEAAGSRNVIHLHGELFKSQSTKKPSLVYDVIGTEINLGDKCGLGSQLRPFIVWFGEAVPMMDVAVEIAAQADIFVVIGTSLAVYPAAGLIHYVERDKPIFIIDPVMPEVSIKKNITFIEETASVGAQMLKDRLLDDRKTES